MKRLYFLFTSVVLSSCISIPKQAPELSEQLGKQISSLEKSHVSLLNSYFDQKRHAVDEFVDKVWLPEFAANFFKNPEISDAWNEIVNSKDTKDRLDFLVFVGPQLQEIINEKRQELTAPLNALERELESVIREEYTNARSMNNTLTSYLVSASKVKENQQRYLDMLKLTDDKISKAIDQTDSVIGNLVSEAEKVKDAVDKVEKYSSQADEYKKKLIELKDKIRN